MSTLNIPNSSFSPSTTIISAQMNANFAAITTWANGSITDTNFGTMAGVITWSVTSNVLAQNISSSSTEGVVDINHTGVLGSSKSTFKVASSANQTTGDALAQFELTSASSSIPLIGGDNAGTGSTVKVIDSQDSSKVKLEIDEEGEAKVLQLRSPGHSMNLGIAEATTAETADSIKITSASGSALSATNPAFVALNDGDNPGQLAIFRIEADVTIDLTGAHWGFGAGGDLTDQKLYVFAIDDSGTLKWGVGRQVRTSLLNTDSSATPASVTGADDVLVNSALSAGTWPSEQVGWFQANFDDTGGASEDLWAVQTDVGDLNVGASPDPTVDDSTIGVNGSGQLQLKDDGTTFAKLAARTVGTGLGNWQLSSSCGAFTAAAAGSPISGTVTNLSVTLNCKAGTPVFMALVPADDSANSSVSYPIYTSGANIGALVYKEGSTKKGRTGIANTGAAIGAGLGFNGYYTVFAAAGGSQTYSVDYEISTGTYTLSVNNYKLVVINLV